MRSNLTLSDSSRGLQRVWGGSLSSPILKADHSSSASGGLFVFYEDVGSGEEGGNSGGAEGIIALNRAKSS